MARKGRPASLFNAARGLAQAASSLFRRGESTSQQTERQQARTVLQELEDLARLAGEAKLARSINNLRKSGRDAVAAARQLLETAGGDVTPPPAGASRGPGRGGAPPGGGPAAPPGFPPEDDHGNIIPTVPEVQRMPSREPGQEHEWTEETVVAHQSSNVYAYRYHPSSSTLEVTFQAPLLQSGVRLAKSRGGLQRFAGQRGRTIKQGSSGQRGASYWYFQVPAGIYQRLVDASSKGKAVWDHLRVRGTVWGHQYRYALAGAALFSHNGQMGAYVPRKASRRGYITRTVRELGGRRYMTSSLPQVLVDRGEPDRGTPDRGAPNRG